jgi:hypothetical protein
MIARTAPVGRDEASRMALVSRRRPTAPLGRSEESRIVLVGRDVQIALEGLNGQTAVAPANRPRAQPQRRQVRNRHPPHRRSRDP